MIRISLLIWLSWLLSACASVSAYQPNIFDIVDPLALARDEAICMADAKKTPNSIDFAQIANAGAQGAANNAAAVVINPLVPVAGGLGSAGAALLGQIGLLGTTQRRVFLWCLHDKGFKSGAYALYDSNL